MIFIGASAKISFISKTIFMPPFRTFYTFWWWLGFRLSQLYLIEVHGYFIRLSIFMWIDKDSIWSINYKIPIITKILILVKAVWYLRNTKKEISLKDNVMQLNKARLSRIFMLVIGNNNWRRRWLDFRNGHSIYLVFLMTFATFVTIQTWCCS